MKLEPDHAAARAHRKRAEQHYAAAERLRKLGFEQSADQARKLAEADDRLAEQLANPESAVS